MPLVVSQKEFENISRLPAGRRYEYFIKRIVDAEEIWSLRSDEGWVLAADDDGSEVFPI